MISSGSPMTLDIDGKRYTCSPAEWKDLDVIETSPGEYHVLEEGKSHHIRLLSFDLNNRTCDLMVDGEVRKVRLIRELDILIEQMGLNASENKKLKSLASPMPGLVTGIRVSAGQHVEKGSPLLILEAMKMENVITSPQPAIIKAVNVIPGQSVNKNDVLITFE